AQLFDDLVDMSRVFRSRARIVAPVRAAIRIGQCSFMYPGRRARSARPVMFVRANVDHGVSMAVIRSFERDHVAPPGARARQPQGQFVRLAAGIDEEAYAERLGQRRAETRGVLID